MPASAATRLLNHYRRTARRLPWRSPPGAPPPDPYRVWLSEVMLQQTTVAAVAPRFERFVARWPTVNDLAQARDEDILGEWAGLGYYARARNLIACARDVARRGGFPDSEAELRALAGIGPYTAAAIAAIAFGRDSTPVDTNVERVVARLHALTRRAEIRAAAQAMTPRGAAGDFAQALMDLGATICRPRDPLCPDCPLQAGCAAFKLGRPGDFPPPKARWAKPHRHGIALWHRRGDDILLVRRPAKGLLGGMAALPGPDWTAPGPPRQAIATVRHAFTHFTLDLHVVEGRGEPAGEGWWQGLGDIAGAGLPTLYRAAVDKVLAAQSGMLAANRPAMLESRQSPP
ncbi:MAG TPA: A/G-specific adenine glycosylase [Sphingomicrobium sp.]|nr:A/G-specific adenine glycosylase [Sphingomicrobium sp.]